MNRIPTDLVSALMKLGLLKSEAKIYIALVMMNSPEVKELIDFVGMSKPNTYESLRSLEEMGLIVPISERPVVYQAVAPEIGLEMLIDLHLKAKNEATKLFSTLPRNIGEIREENIWLIFSEKNLSYKITDMIKNAKQSVTIAAAEKYVGFLKPLAKKNIDIDAMILTDSPEVKAEVQSMLRSRHSSVQFIDRTSLIRLVSLTKAMNQDSFVPAFENIFGIMNFENMIILIVDDADFIYVPPFFGDSQTAMSSKGSVMIENMKVVYKAMVANFIERSKR